METLATVLSIIGSVVGLYVALKHSMKKTVKEPLEHKLDKLTRDDCKNFLVKFLNDKEEGLPQNEACISRAYEVKDRAKRYGVNSYIAKKWKEIMQEEW